MAFDTLRKKYTREPFKFVEIEVGGTAYRFGQNEGPLPTGFVGKSTMSNIIIAPTEIDLTGGIGVRASASISCIESPDYSVWGTPANPERFWCRWRAENPFYYGERVSYYSGYIPESGLFDESNFIKRDYIIEGFSLAAGGVSITGKDPLKLASNDKAKVPLESGGALDADMTDTDTSFTLTPSGIGDLEYPASNGIVRIGDEVILYTTRTGDTISGLTRGYYNTAIDSHSENDAVQLCLEISSETIDYILNLFLTTYGGVDSSYIPLSEWQAEVSNNFITTYSVLLTEPTGVQDAIQEFCQSAPVYLYYDERVNKIRLSALKPPPSSANIYRYDKNIIGDSTVVKDMQDMRVSTVIVNYGIIDPTKDLDEASNYRATYSREDTDSVTDNNGVRAYHTVNSRWIASDNKTAAVLMAARIGRRFAKMPRKVSFSLDPKHADIWTGDDAIIQTDLIMEAGTGDYPLLNYQIISAVENTNNYDYVALEHTYGDALPQDEDIEDTDVRLIYITGENDRLIADDGTTPRSLRDYYEDVYGTDPLSSDLDIRFIIDNSAVAGSSEQSEYSIRTGSWPELATPILIQNNGLIVGKGGDGRTLDGQDGGGALQLEDDIRLNNLSIIGGGGGGGGGESNPPDVAQGGGGAGFVQGQSGLGEDGTYTTGGTPSTEGQAGKGGDLGQDGENGATGVGGSAGKAIDLNGFTITYISTGTILGDIS